MTRDSGSSPLSLTSILALLIQFGMPVCDILIFTDPKTKVGYGLGKDKGCEKETV
jgi:hypothetical protein